MQQLVEALPANRRAQLRHAFGGDQAIQAGHQGILQRSGNGHGGDWPRQGILPLAGDEEPGFQDGFGQLFDKQRHAIGFLHQMPHDLRRQGFPPAHLPNELFHMRAR